MLFDRQQQPYPRGGDHERITNARREAEALFTAKQPVSTPSVPDQPVLAGQSPRKPRILRALSPAPVRQGKSEAPVDSKPRMPPEIPSSHFARIRTWVKYGMTAEQVAGVYGVGTETIERILRPA
jgi:hypothetical protein